MKISLGIICWGLKLSTPTPNFPQRIKNFDAF